MGTDYIFPSALIRSREKKLIKEEQFRSMTDSGSLDEICSAIQNAGYGSETLPFRLDTYQQVLKDENSNIFNEIKELSESYEGLNVLIYVNDYHNIKVFIKAELLGIDRSDIILNNGTIPAKVMEEAVRDRKATFVTDYMHDAVMESAEVFGRTRDPQYVDFVCDKYCFMEINRAAEASNNEFIKGYIKLWIDTINLKTYLRVKSLGYGKSYFQDVFVPGGDMDLVTYTKVYEADAQNFAARFNASDLHDAITAGREHLDKTGDYSVIEKLCDNALVDYIKGAQRISYGVEVLFAYLVAKQMEIKNIRILMAGKIAGMSPEKIAERIRKTYE